MAGKTFRPGHEALQSCEIEVLIATRNNFKDVAMHLRNKGILEYKKYQDATDTMSMTPLNTRVQLVFDHLAHMALQNNNHFITFLNILHEHTNSDETVEMLIQVYSEKGGNIEDVYHLIPDNSVLPDQPGSYSDLSSQAFEIHSDCQIVKSDMTDDQKVKFAVEQMDLNQQDLKDINGKGTKIAIIDLIGTKGDKGFHCKHKAFDGIITEDDIKCFKKQKFKDVGNHVTMCAGIAVGKPFKGKFLRKGRYFEQDYEGGVAPGAKASIFLIERDLDCFLDALKAVQSGNFDVVSISLGHKEKGEGEGLPEDIQKQLDNIREAIIKLGDSTHIVISAGNYGRVKGVLFPANIEDKVISVGGFNEFGRKLDFTPDCVSFTGYGEVCAPATPASGPATGLLQWATGTSMATPAIAGLICLFIQCAKEGKYPNGEDDRKDVLQRIKQKDSMLHILKKTINDEEQVKPAEILRAIKKLPDFKIWFDEMTSDS